MKLEGAIFDLDGTLVESMHIWETFAEDFLLHIGISEFPKDIREQVRPYSLQDVAKYFVKVFKTQKSEEQLLNEIFDMLLEIYKSQITFKSGVHEFLEKLSQNGIKMTVATANEKSISEAVLEKLELRAYFSEIFTCTCVGKSKKFPVVYEAAFVHMGTKKENTVVFEDSYHSLCTAKKGGFITAAVYDKFEKNMEKMKNTADFYIADYTKAAELFEF